MSKKTTINKNYCIKALESDDKDYLISLCHDIKQQIENNNKDIASDIRTKQEFEDEPFFIERLDHDIEVKTNWNKSLEYHLQLAFKKIATL